MSRIMRELEYEGRAARAPQSTPAPAAPPPPPLPPVYIDIDDENGCCSHGIPFSRACIICGRWPHNIKPANPTPDPAVQGDWPFIIGYPRVWRY